MENINEQKEVKEEVKKKNFWRRFNPSLKEIEDRHPNISILGLWWSWYWRLIVLSFLFCFLFIIIAFIFSLFFHS